jgi:hypothetical protein
MVVGLIIYPLAEIGKLLCAILSLPARLCDRASEPRKSKPLDSFKLSELTARARLDFPALRPMDHKNLAQLKLSSRYLAEFASAPLNGGDEDARNQALIQSHKLREAARLKILTGRILANLTPDQRALLDRDYLAGVK